MSVELRTQVFWRKGVKKFTCVLIGGQTVKLQKDDGEVIFDLSKEQITKIRIQQYYIYINQGKTVHTVNVLPEANSRIKNGTGSGSLNATVDDITNEWKHFFDSSSENTGPTAPRFKVSRISAAGLGTVTALLFISTTLLNSSNKKAEIPATTITSPQSQLVEQNTVPVGKEFVISGYSTDENYTNRTPDWDTDVSYTSYEQALEAGKNWQQSKGAGATVEIIEIYETNRGRVVAVYDKNGLELIQ